MPQTMPLPDIAAVRITKSNNRGPRRPRTSWRTGGHRARQGVQLIARPDGRGTPVFLELNQTSKTLRIDPIGGGNGMRFRTWLVCALFLSGVSLRPFGQSCPSPSFPSPTATPIDDKCGPDGNGGAETSQNEAKNNFCASGTRISSPPSKTIFKDGSLAASNARIGTWSALFSPSLSPGKETITSGPASGEVPWARAIASSNRKPPIA